MNETQVFNVLSKMVCFPFVITGAHTDRQTLQRCTIKNNIAYDNQGNKYFPAQMDGSVDPPFECFYPRYGKIKNYPDGEYWAYLFNVNHNIKPEEIEKYLIKPKKNCGKSEWSKANYASRFKDWVQATFNTPGWKEFAELFPNKYPGFCVKNRIGDESFVPKAKEIYLDRYNFDIYYNEYPFNETIFEFRYNLKFSDIIDDIAMDSWDKKYCPWFRMNCDFTEFLDDCSKDFMRDHFYNKDNWEFNTERDYESATSKSQLIELINGHINSIWGSYSGTKYY